MKASNNSPLPKGDLNNQELTKTKGTIWKPLITVSLLSVFSFISGQYLPYVIIAVSGSGPIAAVPLAIFAVSTAVALISTIYLIRLAVSRADNKKEEPQEFVCENCTNLENEPTEKGFDKSVKQDSGSKTEVRGSEHVDTNPKLTPQQPPLTFGTAIPQNNNAPPPPMPTPEQLNQASVAARENSANTTGEKSLVGTTQKNTTTTKKFTPSKGGKQQENRDLMAELFEKLKSRRKGIAGGQKNDVQQPSKLEEVYDKISNMIPPPRSRSSSVSSNGSEKSEQD